MFIVSKNALDFMHCFVLLTPTHSQKPRYPGGGSKVHAVTWHLECHLLSQNLQLQTHLCKQVANKSWISWGVQLLFSYCVASTLAEVSKWEMGLVLWRLRFSWNLPRNIPPRLCPLLPLAHPHLHERDDAGAEPLHRPRLRAQRRLRGRASNEPSQRFHNHNHREPSPDWQRLLALLHFRDY